MGVEDQAPSAAEVAEAATSEAQIALDCGGGVLPAAAVVRGAGERGGPGDP